MDDLICTGFTPKTEMKISGMNDQNSKPHPVEYIEYSGEYLMMLFWHSGSVRQISKKCQLLKKKS